MKNFCIVLAFFSAFLLVSCDSGLKFKNPLDPNNQSAQSDAGKLGGECYKNKTCNEGLICDEESNICIEESENTSDNDNTGTASENSNDESDSPCTEGRFKCYSAFVSYICSDGEWQHFKECAIDEMCNDETGRCVSKICYNNPCDGVAHSTGICMATGAETYSCLCETDFFWDGSACVNPCDEDPCNSAEHSICKPSSFDHYTCTCDNAADGYFWSGSACVNPCDEDPCNSAEHSICKPSSFDHYTCTCDNAADGYFWSGSACVNPCDEDPCNSAEHSVCTPSSFDQYICSCDNAADGYFWSGSACVNPCDANPCDGLANSTGICMATGAETYSCDCETDFFWDGSACVNPCDANPCDGVAHSTGICMATGVETYSCDCETDFFWDGSACVNPCDNNPCPSAEHLICTPSSFDQYTCTCDNAADGYFWSGTACVNPCDADPCDGLANSTEICTAKGAETYFCGCNAGYNWRHQNCEIIPKVFGNICTGQTSCHAEYETIACPTSSSDDFFGQDAQYRNKCVAQSFTPGTGVQAGTVIDNNTGLIWEQSPSENEYIWNDAQNHCTDLNSSNYAGINSWRVPNPLELLTIVDNSTYDPATNSNFTGMPTWEDSSGLLWTSAEYKSNTSYAYAFMPYYGLYYGYEDSDCLKTKTYKVLCVSGDEMQPATSSNFTTQTISGSVVVTDSKTGLMWQKEYVTDKTWQQALKYCEDSTYAGYSDWRLPNKNELSSLINYEKSGAPYSYFPDMLSSGFWSSSTLSDSTGYACYVGFYHGVVLGYGKTLNYGYVRCVR